MTNEEVNRYIHEKIMEKCWHERRPTKHNPANPQMYIAIQPGCRKCGKRKFAKEDFHPDYCSDESKRSLLNEVVAKMDELGFYHELLERLEEAHGVDLGTLDDIWCDGGKVFRSTAAQIARACEETHRGNL